MIKTHAGRKNDIAGQFSLVHHGAIRRRAGHQFLQRCPAGNAVDNVIGFLNKRSHPVKTGGFDDAEILRIPLPPGKRYRNRICLLFHKIALHRCFQDGPESPNSISRSQTAPVYCIEFSVPVIYGFPAVFASPCRKKLQGNPFKILYRPCKILNMQLYYAAEAITEAICVFQTRSFRRM